MKITTVALEEMSAVVKMLSFDGIGWLLVEVPPIMDAGDLKLIQDQIGKEIPIGWTVLMVPKGVDISKLSEDQLKNAGWSRVQSIAQPSPELGHDRLFGLRQIQQEVAEWAARNFKGKLPHQPLLGVAEEVGELCHAHLKLEQGIRVNENHQEKKVDAVGDIIIYLVDYCIQNQIDIADALGKTWDAVKQRNWTEKKEDGVNQ